MDSARTLKDKTLFITARHAHRSRDRDPRRAGWRAGRDCGEDRRPAPEAHRHDPYRAAAIDRAGGTSLALACDIRDEAA
jgi:hypothetical protein